MSSVCRREDKVPTSCPTSQLENGPHVRHCLTLGSPKNRGASLLILLPCVTVQLPSLWQGSGKGLGAIAKGQGQGRKGGCAVKPVLAEQEQKAVKGSVRKGAVEGQESSRMRRWCGQEQVGLTWGQAQKAQGSPVATQTCTGPRPYTDTVSLAFLLPPPLQAILDQSQANSRPELTSIPTILQGKELPNVRSPYSAKTECDSGWFLLLSASASPVLMQISHQRPRGSPQSTKAPCSD